ncbi:MAG: HEAT repeat domain-containing protein [Candidatus Sumerlaeota bacterium]|nr:HEAT repeat domain-containing protein [Candidatus Sumerlaeota bacterium]
MGKSTCLNNEYERIRQTHDAQAQRVMFVDLAHIESDTRFIDKIFNSDEYREWLKDSSELIMFLDSLDECRLHIKHATRIIIEELQKAPLIRLKFRITCRGAEWPSTFEDDLKSLWQSEELSVYRLQPLTHDDILCAAKALHVNPDTFIEEVIRTESTSFASAPITLDFILSTYAAEGALPRSKLELYRKGCQKLCTENNKSRKEAYDIGNLSPLQRISIASRIAAMVVICGRGGIWLEDDLAGKSEMDLSLAEIAGADEDAEGVITPVTEQCLREVTSTALFSTEGPSRARFAHQTYAEFLAAHYLAMCNISLPQALSLFTDAGPMGRQVIPQLQETAAWLAGMRRDFFHALIQIDQMTLIRADVGDISGNDKELLVKHILDKACKGTFIDSGNFLYHDYQRLSHSKLFDQLRPVILDRTACIPARRIAIDISEACCIGEAGPLLADIVCDRTEHNHIRAQAALALAKINDAASCRRLCPLLSTEDFHEDDGDELRGALLKCLWPQHITVMKMLSLVQSPKNPNLIGHYSVFINNDVVIHLKEEDIVHALNWVTTKLKDDCTDQIEHCARLLDQIFKAAIAAISDPGIITSLASAAIEYLRSESRHGYANKFLEYLSSLDCEIRRSFLKTLIDVFAQRYPAEDQLGWYYDQLFSSEDFFWILDQCKSEKDAHVLDILLDLVERSYRIENSSHTNELILVAHSLPIIEKRMKYVFGNYDLKSPDSQKLKERYYRNHRREEEDQQKQVSSKPSRRQTVLKVLKWIQNGHASEWLQLNFAMGLDDTSSKSAWLETTDITLLPGWLEAEDDLRDKIINCAHAFVISSKPMKKDFSATEFINHDLAACHALMLLRRPEYSQQYPLPDEVWHKWAISLLDYPRWNGIDVTPLVQLAFHFAPEESIQALLQIVDGEIRKGGNISCLNSSRRKIT